LQGNWFSAVMHDTSRHTILFGVAFTLTLVSLTRWLFIRFTPYPAASQVLVAILLMTWLHQAAWTVWAHGQLLRDAMVRESLLLTLRQQAPPPVGSIVWLQLNQSMRPRFYNIQESNLLLYEAYHKMAWISGIVYSDKPSRHQDFLVGDMNRLREIASTRSADVIDFNLASGFKDAHCVTRYVFSVPEFNLIDVFLLLPINIREVPAAALLSTTGNCTTTPSHIAP